MNALNIRDGGVYADVTAGGGGHSAEILKRMGDGRLLLTDRDPDAIAVLKERFGADERVTVEQGNYSDVGALFREAKISGADGILADLGVSSHQLDTAERGFSFHSDAPLDMRMSQTGVSAYDVVNTYDVQRLKTVIWSYGEEKFAPRIAAGIVNARQKKPIETTFELVDVIKASMPKAAQRESHPARRTFQAIRIEVNGELDGLTAALPELFKVLNPGGVLAVITFHSLEDRIVKEYFKRLGAGCTCPKDFPVCVCGKKPLAKVRSAGITPSDKELGENPRSRSAKLRIAIKE